MIKLKSLRANSEDCLPNWSINAIKVSGSLDVTRI
jgi:hypothetical protein